MYNPASPALPNFLRHITHFPERVLAHDLDKVQRLDASEREKVIAKFIEIVAMYELILSPKI